MRGLKIVITIVAVLLCQSPAVYCSGPDEVLPSTAVNLPGDPARDLFAFQATPARPHKSAPAAPDFSQSFGVLLSGVWGTASNKTEFSTGTSRLDWPMDFQLVGASYKARYRDIVEWEISLQGCPWTRSVDDMKDYDYLDDAQYGYPAHDGTDIYSESTTDSKAFILDTDLRVFALSYRYAAMGIYMGYQAQEMDFKTYDLRQTGYGPWSVYTLDLTGPCSTYTLNHDFLSLGLTWRLKAGDRASLTVDTAFIPYAHLTDEDEHLRRYRQSKTDCTGTGTMLSMTGNFALTGNWYVSSSCSKIHISADGHQKQYWWGDDPGFAGDETGSSITGIDSTMKQDSFHIGLALCRRL